jgi:hypothetical protein
VQQPENRRIYDDRSEAFLGWHLYKLLVVRIIDCNTPRGAFSVAAFAKKIGYSPEGLYKYLRSDSLSVPGARAILKACADTIEYADLVPFMFKHVSPGALTDEGASFLIESGGVAPSDVAKLLFPN